METLDSLEPHLALLIQKEFLHVKDEWNIVLSLLLRTVETFEVDLSAYVQVSSSAYLSH